ncbi:hypothetical protein BAME_38770 [Bacillus sp. M 2-6]|nr:hypothetical protein BAME_38770 [Bacillus sp. M 2-6]
MAALLTRQTTPSFLSRLFLCVAHFFMYFALVFIKMYDFQHRGKIIHNK